MGAMGVVGNRAGCWIPVLFTVFTVLESHLADLWLVGAIDAVGDRSTHPIVVLWIACTVSGMGLLVVGSLEPQLADLWLIGAIDAVGDRGTSTMVVLWIAYNVSEIDNRVGFHLGLVRGGQDITGDTLEAALVRDMLVDDLAGTVAGVCCRLVARDVELQAREAVCRGGSLAR